MVSRFTVFAALAGALLSLSPLPSRADTASDIKALQAAVSILQGTVASQQKTIASQQTQINALKSVTSGFSRVTDTSRTDGRKGTELYLTGFNLHVVNGLGATNGDPHGTGTTHINGLGNIIIGYNLWRDINDSDSSSKFLNLDYQGHKADVRSGSHNLVVGDCLNYSSYGGLVAGNDNAVRGPYASVSGGFASTASGQSSSISGGLSNTASGKYSSVPGGSGNSASGSQSTVSGGFENMAQGMQSTICGGQFVLNKSEDGFAAGGLYSESKSGPGTFHSPRKLPSRHRKHLRRV